LHEDPSGTTVHSSLPETAFVADLTDPRSVGSGGIFIRPLSERSAV
jgi:hypothetical protein